MESAVSEHLEHVKEWIESFRQDVEIIKTVVTSQAVDERARRYAAAALSYLVTRMDLVPDWNGTIGLLDDVMVLRVCMDLALAHQVEKPLAPEIQAGVERLIDDTHEIEEFLGGALYAKLRKHCEGLSAATVRGRSPEQIASDQDARKALFDEIEDDLSRVSEVTFEDEDEDAIALNFKSYLHHKLV
jgi:uncharacterized membrane protein YkvA (DUF1232 family)